MYQVNITDSASTDLKNASLYISSVLNNKVAANRLLDHVAVSFSSLSDSPMRNPLVRDSFLAANGIRIQVIDNYLAFYIVREELKSVTILRFLHARRDWISILKDDSNR